MGHAGLQAETVTFRGHNGDEDEAYYARPLHPGKFPGVVVIHHMPGWDEWTTEVVRKFAYRGYVAIAPHLFFRFGPGSRTMSRPGLGLRVALRMRRSKATSQARWPICARNLMRAA